MTSALMLRQLVKRMTIIESYKLTQIFVQNSKHFSQKTTVYRYRIETSATHSKLIRFRIVIGPLSRANRHVRRVKNVKVKQSKHHSTAKVRL